MSAALLREAAALMRERAEAATSIYCEPHPKAGQRVPWFGPADTYDFDDGDGPHIVSWHPAVALAVAKAMDDVALAWEIYDGAAFDEEGMPYPFEESVDGGWLTVARAYLGRDS